MRAVHSLLGTYRTPQFTYGSDVFCEVRGEVVITGLSSARIPWPIAKHPGGRARALVVYAGLAGAVRRESASAVCYWRGVTGQTASKWRKEMGVGVMTEGTTRLKSQIAKESPGMARVRRKAWRKARDPERCRKIAESKKGKPRPEHVVKAMRQGRLGRPHSPRGRMEPPSQSFYPMTGRRGFREPNAG